MESSAWTTIGTPTRDRDFPVEYLPPSNEKYLTPVRSDACAGRDSKSFRSLPFMGGKEYLLSTEERRLSKRYLAVCRTGFILVHSTSLGYSLFSTVLTYTFSSDVGLPTAHLWLLLVGTMAVFIHKQFRL